MNFPKQDTNQLPGTTKNAREFRGSHETLEQIEELPGMAVQTYQERLFGLGESLQCELADLDVYRFIG